MCEITYTEEQISAYIGSKKLAWAPTTLRSETARLRAALTDMHLGPELLYKKLVEQGKRPYSIKTLFIRLGEFEAFISSEKSLYKKFMQESARVFKNAYLKERITISFEEAQTRVERIADETIKQVARAILKSGLRAHEALKYDGSGFVIGKGGKERAVYLEAGSYKGPSRHINYTDLYKGLKEVGLKPHTLRKLAATRLVSAGFTEVDLMEVMGWNSIQTASSYIQPTKQALLKTKVMEALK